MIEQTQSPEQGTTPEGEVHSDSNAEPILYDADAQQHMTFKTERKGKLYRVTHIFGAIKDEAVMDYERGRDQRLSDADENESNDQDAVALTSKSFEAAVKYWDDNGTQAEGYAGNVSDKDKAFAVQNLLFAVEFESLPLADAKETCPEDDDDNSSYRLRSLFDGKLVSTELILRPAKKEEISEFQMLMQRALLVKGTQFGQTDQRIPSRARGLGNLFDKVKAEAKGYTRRIPLHHKMAVTLRHFRAQQKANAGN